MSLQLGEGQCCFACLQDAARLGLDKRGRPYLHCVACGSRQFFPQFDPCCRGLAILPPLIHAHVAQLGWPEVTRRTAERLAEMRRLRDVVTGDLPLPAASLAVERVGL
jgi:hypothetical protein